MLHTLTAKVIGRVISNLGERKLESYSAIKKQWNPIICRKMSEPGGHYVKWNNPETEKQKLGK
jgi:hypothetical protein